MYKTIRNKVTRMKFAARSNHCQENIKNAKINNQGSRKTWEIVNEIIEGKSKDSNQYPKKIKLIGSEQTTENSNTIADVLNDHFVNVGEKLGKNMTSSLIQGESSLSYLKGRINNSIFCGVRSKEDVSKLIDELRKSAMGPDEVPTSLIKAIKGTICMPLTKIINLSISTGIFPDKLKLAEVIPVYKKKGSKADPTNYRPISLLSHFAKIFERVIYNLTLNFFNKHKILSRNQYGFRQNYSTILAMNEIHEKLLDNFEDGKITCTIFIDLAKAFDTVDHKILLKKLEFYGIRGNLLSLFKSYLTGRMQCVRVNGVRSSYRTVKMGVPQGSVLGPLLFLVFINDLPMASNFYTKLFADDTFLLMSSQNLKNLEKKVDDEMKNICAWLKANKLFLNVTKSKFMLLTQKKNINKDDFHVYADNMEMARTNNYNYLGIVIDEKLTWQMHIEQLCSKMAQISGKIYRLRQYVDKDTLVMVYNALVYSRIHYSVVTWGTACKSVLKPLIVEQNKIIRFMTFSSRMVYDLNPMYSKLNILKLNDVYKLEVAKFMYRYQNGKLPENFDHLFINLDSIHKYGTRQSTNQGFYMIRTRTKKGKNKIQYSGPLLWNEINLDIKQCPNLHAFSKKYKIFLIDKYKCPSVFTT